MPGYAIGLCPLGGAPESAFPGADLNLFFASACWAPGRPQRARFAPQAQKPSFFAPAAAAPAVLAGAYNGAALFAPEE